MQPRHPSLIGSIVTFAHRGGMAHGVENTLETFTTGLALGAGGLESDARLSADGEVVLVHDATIGRRPRRRLVAETLRRDLPPEVCTLAELYERIGTDVEISLDVCDPAAFEPIIATATAAGGGAEGRLWLCSPDLGALQRWRRSTKAKLINSIRLRNLKQSTEQLVFSLRDAGVDGLNLHHSEWSGGLVALAHKADRLALAWDAQHDRELAKAIDSGIDAIYSDHVDRMVAAAEQFYPPPAER